MWGGELSALLLVNLLFVLAVEAGSVVVAVMAASTAETASSGNIKASVIT